MNIQDQHGLAFDDVLLVPKRSDIRSRSDVDISNWLVASIKLSIPIISANMDTVTETDMAIAMSHAGGIGILHRFMPIQQQVNMVKRVKRSESFVVENPINISPDAILEDAREQMAAAGIGGLMVTNPDGKLLGILTTRDLLLAPDMKLRVIDVMTPRGKLIVASADEPISAARVALHAHRIEKLPLVDKDDCVVGLITAQDIVKLHLHPQATKDGKGRLIVGAAVGVRTNDLERSIACVEAGADLLVIDIAHGHSDHVIEMIKKLKDHLPDTPIIAGNVATYSGVRDLALAGAAAVKVGVGSGSICTTRIVTGFGVPQLTAITDCARAGHELGVPIIADGGIRTPGDLTKALAAGASSVMLGSMLAGTEESPGPAVIRNGRRYKVVRGMASLSANIARKEIEKMGEIEPDEWEAVIPEGVEAVVPYRGKVGEIIHQLVGGLRSGMSYAGAKSIAELWEKAEFIQITPAALVESKPHDVGLI
jgi:IMP dehydrogenase